MNSMLLVESIDVEFNALYEACDSAIAYATARFMEDDNLFPRYFKEAEEEKKERSGGLLGFIKSIFKAIGEMLSNASKKVKSVLFGSEVDHSKDNEKVNGKDANAMQNFMNKAFADGKTMLGKAAKGEVTVEEAQKYKDDCKAKVAAIGTTAMSLASMFGITKVSEKYIAKWNAELDQLYKTVEVEVESLEDGTVRMANAGTMAEEKLARTSSDSGKKEIIKQTTQIILSSLQDSTRSGIGGIEDNIKLMYAKNYIKNKLQKGEQQFTDPKALKEAQKQAKADAKATAKEVDRLEKEDRQIKRASDDKAKMDAANQKSNAQLNAARNKRYNDSNEWVDDEALNNDDYDSIEYKKRRRKEEKEVAKQKRKENFSNGLSKLRKTLSK